ncbi:transglutaminase family protein [Pontibacter sp. G13]|uniref:transglutaminase family protein n=1 Tax=Pontibacter sp. G13 TaxID=3074898 RepID=UPI002889F78D|nr:transglutaminase family protein [Pontibacter sp. G13]WNJ17739.1 transglutaminase family protein [Pontibacter sp. G13]
MSQRKQLPFLLSLLEDDSPTVREQVRTELKLFGPGLSEMVTPFRFELDDESLRILDEICQEVREEHYTQGWLSWLEIEDTKESLEKALVNLAYLEYGQDAESIPAMLNDLASAYLLWTEEKSVSSLMTFLFQEHRFKAPGDLTYSHLHDNILYTIRVREGSQIALSCLAILVGKRAGLELDGISIQGNFMACSFESEKLQMYNSFNKGRPLARASLMYIEEALRRNQIPPAEMKARVHEIVAQILRKTIDQHHQQGFHQEAREYVKLYQNLAHALRARGITDPFGFS